VHFELVGLGSDIPLRVIADVILAMPGLTYLRICAGKSEYGVLGAAIALPTESFPRHLHTIDISLYRGMDLFFQWLLSYERSPVFASLKLGGRANGARIEPINAYFQLFGPRIESLSLEYDVDSQHG
jgi:hypothetical protein